MAQNSNHHADTTTEVDLAISKSEKFLHDHNKSILWTALAIVVVAIGVAIFNHVSQNNEQAAQEQIYAGQFLFEAGDYEQALGLFEDVIDQYNTTPAGNLAKAYAGLCHKNLGNYESAIKVLNGYKTKDALVGPAVESALGDCYVETGDYATAAKHFVNAAKEANNEGMSPLFLFKAGLAYEKCGDKAGALKAYQTVKDKWTSTAVGQEIEKYIYRVQ